MSSKVVFGIGIALSVAAISSIFVTMVAGQTQQDGQQAQTNTQTSSTNQSQQGAGTTITIPKGASSQQVQDYYKPPDAQVPSGAKVTWKNQDSAPHTATAKDGSFDTGTIQAGASGSAVVQGQGKVSYYCSIHPFMTATLQISGSGGEPQQQGQQNETQISQQPASSQKVSDAVQQLKEMSPSELAQALEQLGQDYQQAATALQGTAGAQNATGQANETSTASEPTQQSPPVNETTSGNQSAASPAPAGNGSANVNQTGGQTESPSANASLLERTRESVDSLVQRLENVTKSSQ